MTDPAASRGHLKNPVRERYPCVPMHAPLAIRPGTSPVEHRALSASEANRTAVTEVFGT